MDKLHGARLKTLVQVLKYLFVMNLEIRIKKLRLSENLALRVCLIKK